MTTESKKTTAMLAIFAMAASALAFSCKSPLFGLGGQVDTAIPGISVSELEEGGVPRTLVNGDYVRGSITLRGGVSDDLGIASVALSFDENGSALSIAATVDSKAQNWEASINTADYIDGSKDLVVTVTDTAGKTSTTRFVLYFDNRPPTVLLTVPAADEGTASESLYGTVDVKGSAADQFGIRKVRVYLYNSSKTLIYESPDDASIGTNSFALRLDTDAIIGKTGAEIGYVYVQAWDRSGNTNTQFYRLDEVKDLNADQGATVEELHALETGTASTANGLTLNEIAGVRRYKPGTGYGDDEMISYYFDQSTNLPVITISNPEEGKTAEQNLLSKSAKAMGLVQDANGVASVEIRFRLIGGTETDWYADATPGAAGGDIEVSGTGRVVNWSTDALFGQYGGIAEGVQSIRVRAADADGNERLSDWVDFTIDGDAPYIEITDPKPGDYVNGDPIVIAGAAEVFGDGTNTVASVEVYVNATTGWQAATTLTESGQEADWTYAITSAQYPTDGNFSIKARVSDDSGKTALYNIVVTVDRTPPHGLAFISPTKASSVNGYPTIMGQAKDNVLLKEVYLVFEKSGEEQKLADTYNWSYELDAGMSANTTDGYDIGNNIYRVPFRVKAVDQADNISYSPAFGTDPYNPGAGSYYLDVDLDGDKPEITNIVSPGSENDADDPYVISGSIKVQGTATDDDRLHSVEMALIALSGATESWRSLDGTASVSSGTFYPVNNTSLWSYVLNDSGNLYALSDLSGHKGDFKIIVRAVDTKDLVSVSPPRDVTGDEQTIYVRFDNTLPGVIDLSPEEGTMQSGTFSLTFTAQDNFSIVLAQISYNNGSTYTTLPITPAASVPLTVSVNTKTVNSDAFATSSGTLYMRVRLKDDGNNITEKSFKYLIDNIAPVDVTPPSAATMSNISNRMYTDAGASLAEILGTVKDSGTVRGIDYVEVYFERDGEIYRLNPDEEAGYVTAADYEFTNGDFPYTTDDAYKIIINKAENYVDADGDGYQESLTEGTSGHTWGARFDSSKISDGDVTVHYVAWDQAGNSSHFSVSGAVKNDPPVLTSITLGTNLNGDTAPADTTDDGERVRLTKQADGSWRGYTLKADGTQLGAERAYDLNDPVLTVRNNLFTFAATVSPIVEGGDLNTPLSYRAVAPNGTSTLLNWVAASSYEVTTFATDVWAEDAANTLTIQARDSAYGTPLATEALSFKVKIDNADDTAPEVSLAPLGSRYAEPSSGQSLSYAGRTSETIQAYEDNLYWIDTDSDGDCSLDERLGHVDLPANVSGTVKLGGKVYDDQRVSRITVAFNVPFDLNGTDTDGIVLAGTEIDVAQFTSGALAVIGDRAEDQDPAANTLSFALEGKNSPELSDELGHAVNFTLTWNSAFIEGVAQEDVEVTIKAYNAGSSVKSDDSSQTVDVVPYITDISRDSTYNTHRSSSGAFSLLRGEAGNGIQGFNLGTAGTASLSLSSDKAGAVITTPVTTYAVTSNREATFTLPDTAKDGYLSIVVNGVRSTNNLNDNGLDHNQEALANMTETAYWNDDRLVRVWQSNTADFFAGSANPVFPAMSMDAAGELYASFSNYSTAKVYYSGIGGTATEVFYSFDPSEETSIAASGSGASRQINVLYSANYHGGNEEDWVADADQAGGLYLYDDSAASYYVGRDSRRAYRFELFYHDRMLQQFKNLRVARASADSGERIHVAYYDRITNAIKYTNINDGYVVPTTGAMTKYSSHEISWVKIDGGSDAHDTAAYSDGSSIALGAARFEAELQVSSGTGEMSAITLTSTKLPVVVYYDAANSVLKLARANSTNPKGNQARWTVQSVLLAGDANAGTVVDYIAAKIDDEDRLHIAFQNSKGELVYLKSTNNPTDGNTRYAFGASQVLASSAMWTDLTLRGTTPYISYLSRINSFDGVHITYYDDSLDLDGDGTAEGGWETMTAAMNYKAGNIRTCVAAHPTPATGGWTAAVSFTPGNLYRVVRYIGF